MNRRCSSRVRTVSRANEQSYARLPDSIKLRDPASAKVAAICLAMLAAPKVSSPALAHYPSAHLIITHRPALAGCLRFCCCKARPCAFNTSYSAKLPVHGDMRVQPGRHLTRGAARLGRPSRVAPRWPMRPRRGMDQLLAELERALHAQHAAQTHSPFAPAVWASWGPL